MRSTGQASIAALSPALRRIVRKARELQSDVAQVGDGLQSDLVGILVDVRPGDADEIADLIRTEAGRRPLSVLITAPSTTAAQAAQED